MVSCSMYGAIFTVPSEVCILEQTFHESVGHLLLQIDTLALKDCS